MCNQRKMKYFQVAVEVRTLTKNIESDSSLLLYTLLNVQWFSFQFSLKNDATGPLQSAYSFVIHQ